MDYEKKYKEAINRAKAMVKVAANQNEAIGFANTIFPELAESEDERIRKALIKYLREGVEGYIPAGDRSDYQRWLAWVEKQGEKKPTNKIKPKFKVGDTVTVKPMSCHGKVFKDKPFKIVDIIEDNYVSDDGKTYSISLQDGWELVEQKTIDKVEPKFKVGDWIVNNQTSNIYLVRSIRDDEYCLWCPLDAEIEGFLRIVDVDSECHLWTIQDVKNGDIIAEEPIEGYSSPFVAIYKKQNEEDFDTFDSHCFIGFDGNFYEGEEGHTIEDIHPATKEQYDTLMKAMADAGWEFDFEKKKLKKIEWSEEDEEAIEMAIIALEDIYDEDEPDTTYGGYNLPFDKAAERLKSLKDRYICKVVEQMSKNEQEK